MTPESVLGSDPGGFIQPAYLGQYSAEHQGDVVMRQSLSTGCCGAKGRQMRLACRALGGPI